MLVLRERESERYKEREGEREATPIVRVDLIGKQAMEMRADRVIMGRCWKAALIWETFKNGGEKSSRLGAGRPCGE